MYYIYPPTHLHFRRLYPGFLFLTLALSSPLETWAETASRATYDVTDGDNLSEIAERNQVSVDQLLSWNDLGSDVIQPGQRLFVAPEPTESAAATGQPSHTDASGAARGGSSPRRYVVHEADTLGCIAERFGVSVDRLIEINSGLAPDSLRQGQSLSIPADGVDSFASIGTRHVVREGDTLSEIADELGVEVDDLRRWNSDIEGDTLRPGQELEVRRVRRIVHVVAEGEMVSEIAERYGVTARDIVRWNAGLDPDRISVGQRLSIRSEQPPTESVGEPSCGRLVNGRQLPPHRAYVIRTPERSYATDETIEHIQAAFDEVLRRYPRAPRVRVHDLSLPEGGSIDDHRSHQSGRDVDIAYYQRQCPADLCAVRPVLPRELALSEQWALLEHWLRDGDVHRIFIDYGLQEPLYNYARQHGATQAELEEWFQYPRSRNTPVGVIRHFRNHFDHVHVRFRCPEGDDACQP